VIERESEREREQKKANLDRRGSKNTTERVKRTTEEAYLNITSRRWRTHGTREQNCTETRLVSTYYNNNMEYCILLLLWHIRPQTYML